MPPNYDFHNCLSPREFEELVQGILEIKEKVSFEISGRGKDGGVDLRYWEGETKVIVQVKCYQKNYKQLIGVLKNQEKQKAKAQKPTRYILVTSMQLEMAHRDEIFNLFDGLIASRDDIIDKQDLNKLLGQEQYQAVERTHYKLWLSSTGVLSSLIDEIVHRDILVDSIVELEEIKKTVQVFVQNSGFRRGLDILEKFRYILISGEPGIGKTTLGRALAAYYLQRKGYSEFVYADTVGAARRMYKERESQVFFIDDFWGDTFKKEKHPHNEEKQLLKIIRRVSDSQNKILILTSREYVLQQGLIEYQDEQMRQTFDLGKCFLQLEDYSELVKAKILFNHLYFSRLEWQYVNVIANGYEQITTHPNYNPRIIETFLKQGSVLVDEKTPWEYYKEFLNYLNEPLSFWKSIFIKQTSGAQLTALLLFLSSQPMRIDDLRASYYSCIEVQEQGYRPIQELEFDNIIAQLEKTMIKTYDRDSTMLVTFQNSSIKDFLYYHLANNLDYYGKMLIQGCPFINQLLFIFKTTDARRDVEDWSEEDLFSAEKIRLNEKHERLICDRIIADFDILKYSYVERDIYEHQPSIYDDPEEYKVRKLYDILFCLDTKANSSLQEFLKNKIKHLCQKLHHDEYPFSYDDMVEFPYLVQTSLPLGIDYNESLVITDYYKRCRFAEHLLHLQQFEEVFPQPFSDFKKVHYKFIKRKIRDVFLEDVEFFLLDGEDDRIDYLVDFIYPCILESYKLRDSKKFQKDLKVVLSDYYVGHSNREEEEEENADLLNEKQKEENNLSERIRAEKDALLGVANEIHDREDIEVIDFIHHNAQTAVEASELISFYENEQPWYIWPFFSNLHQLSLLIVFFRDQKKLPQQSTTFYEKFAAYLLRQDRNIVFHVDHIVDMFSEFAFDMMVKGQVIFSEHTFKNHIAFKHRWNEKEIDWSRMLSFPFIVQRGKWYEFQTLAFQAYLSLKHFLKHKEEKNYRDFLNLRGAFVDIEHDIYLVLILIAKIRKSVDLSR